MNKVSTLSLSAMGGGLYTYGVTLFDGDFWRGFVLTMTGVVIVVATAILQKYGYPVSK